MPLPSLEDIFQKVMERARNEAANDRSFETNYSFVRTKTTEYHNSRGVLKKQEIKIRTNNPALVVIQSPPNPVRSQPRSVSVGTPVSDTHSRVRGKAFEQDEFALNGELVKRFEFKLAGRELVNGRSALAVVFQPKSGRLPERNLKDKFINKAAGRVWIDEGDYALVKADLWLTDRVNVIGGLVGAVWKFTFAFERERMADGIWFTRQSSWHLEGRELFVQRTVDFHEERTAVERCSGHVNSPSASLGK